MNMKLSDCHFVKRHWVKLYFVLSLLLVSFAYGYAVNEYRIFPYHVLKDGMDAVLDWKKTGRPIR